MAHGANQTDATDDGGPCLQSPDAALRSIRDIATEAAHLAATIATAETGDARNRIMSVSNMLKAALGRSQSSHGDKFDAQGNKTER